MSKRKPHQIALEDVLTPFEQQLAGSFGTDESKSLTAEVAGLTVSYRVEVRREVVLRTGDAVAAVECYNAH